MKILKYYLKCLEKCTFGNWKNIAGYATLIITLIMPTPDPILTRR